MVYWATVHLGAPATVDHWRTIIMTSRNTKTLARITLMALAPALLVAVGCATAGGRDGVDCADCVYGGAGATGRTGATGDTGQTGDTGDTGRSGGSRTVIIDR